MKSLCISIDLDPLSCYYDIHGVEGYQKTETDLIYSVALERIYEFFQRENIPLTLFVVGSQLLDEVAVRYLKDALDLGYEIGNHSYNHLYNLSLLSEEKIDYEIEECDNIIYRKLGTRPVGFRAPGYNLCPYIIRVITNMEYSYDSSVLPSPFYYFSKATIIFLYKLTGRKTGSICGSIGMPFAERDIYPMGERIYNKARFSTILEIPISVAGFFGIPYIGTFIMGYKDIIHNYLQKWVSNLNLLHIELHGIDFLDSGDVRDERIVKSQFDLKIPLDKKVERLKRLIHRFNPERCVRLSDFRLKDYIFL
ncbi:MAG: polysaccharide deacetylase family protein [Myxococcota bacterium]